ncbi:MAG: ABC transporter permease [Vicinamibacteraceae bacterium]
MTSPERRPAPVSLYRLLLFCYPSGFREEFGEHMAEFFRDQYREVRQSRGVRGTALLWLAVLRDLATVAVKERFSMFMQDLRISLRTLWRSPAFSIVAIATSALGIGAATAIFSVVNGVLLKPVPYAEPDRLAMVYLNAADRGMPRARFSVADFIDWRAHDTAFEQVAAFGAWGPTLTVDGPGEPEQIPGTYATGRFFTILGVRPMLGRVFEAGDDEPGRPRSLVISERLWQRHGADPRMVGATVMVNGDAHTVVGVVPATYRYPSRDTEAWAILPPAQPTRRGPYFLRGIGRLKPSLTAEHAAARLRGVPLGIRTGARPDQKALTFAVVGLQDEMVGEVRPMLVLLLASVGVLLLIAIVNVANLQITRAAGRAREFATRMSIGAHRSQVVRQQLTESLLISGTGGALGILIAFAAVGVLRWAAPASLPRVEDVTVDAAVLGFAVAVSVVAGALFGLAPALRASSQQLTASLSDGGRGATHGREHGRLRSALAVGQIALSCVLLIGAGLLIRSFVALQDVAPGLDTSGLLAVRVAPAGARYADDSATRTFYRELLEKVRSIPGIEAASLSSTVPPGQGGFSENITIEGAAEGEEPVLLLPVVEPRYFRTVGAPLLAGRPFTDGDTAESPGVTVVSDTFARRYFPNQPAVGRRLKIGGRERSNSPWLTIVGVVGDVRYRGLEATLEPVFYVPHAQNTTRAMFLVLHSALPPSALRASIRQHVAALDGTVPVSEPKRIDDLLYESIAQPRFRTVLVGTFAAVALLIAGVGLYGVMAYGVTQRRHEIAIRIALGARSRDVAGGILREALVLALLGVGAGVTGALALQTLVSGFMFGVIPTDAPTFAGVAIVLMTVSLLASYIPARRAARVDPIRSMKAS